MFGFEYNGCKLWFCNGSNRVMAKNGNFALAHVLIPAADQATAIEYADTMFGGPNNHSPLEEVTDEELFRQHHSAFAAKLAAKAGR